MSQTFSSFAVPNYRTYFSGLLIANIGGWMSSTAKQWLVLTILTHGDASALGYLTGLMFLPSLLFAPASGMIADRFPKRKIMLWTQAFVGIDAVILATLTLTGHVRLWHVFLLAFLDGTANALNGPAQQAFVSEIVPRDKLANAISLNSAQFNGARLLGPGLGGFLIALFARSIPEMTATGVVLAINVACFLAFIASLLMLDLTKTTPAELQRGKGQLRAGLDYVRRRPDIMLLMFIAFMMGNFGFNFAISNAVMATRAFGKGAGEFGLLGSILGIGALAAALISARRKRPRLRYVLEALLAFGVFSVISALSPTYEFFAVTLIPIGLCAITVLVTANSMVQMGVADQFRGRVMTLWNMLLLGGTPIVSPMVGLIAAYLGPRATVWFEGITIFLTFAVAMAWLHHSEGIRVRLDRRAGAPWVVVRRRSVTEDTPSQPAR